MANTSTTPKLSPRVSKSPDADFNPEMDPLYDPAYDNASNLKSRPARVEPQATSPWGYVWAALILLAVGVIAYGYFSNGTAPVPSQTTTSVAPAPEAPATTPPSASTTAPAAPAPAAPADGSTTTTPQAPATTTSP